MKSKYSVVDLFAGAGGLSLGFIQSGQYDIKVAFENNPAMQETYKMNHPEVDLRGDVCVANYSEIIAEYGPIDVVIGGPPCQGFSNANRQKSRIVNHNNNLVKEYIRAIKELQPKSFLMENVSMLKSDVHRFYLSADEEKEVTKYGIKTKATAIELLDATSYFPQALAIVKDYNLVEKYLWSEEKYNLLNIIFRASKNPQKLMKAMIKHRSKLLKEECSNCLPPEIKLEEELMWEGIRAFFEEEEKEESLAALIEKPLMFQRMLSRAKEIFDNNLIVDEYRTDNGLTAVVRSYAVYDYLKAVLSSEQNGYIITDKVLCAADYGAPQKRKRYVIMGVKKSITKRIALPHGYYDEDQYRTVREAIEDLELIVPKFTVEEGAYGTIVNKYIGSSELIKELRDSKIIKNHIVTKTTPIAMERFKAIKEGENFHSLKEELKTNTYSNIERTQNTVYLRLKYDEPSGTVINVRKSMWIHPTLDRAISVREAARLQTFPDSFEFCGTKDKQYQQVGNAVPPIMAKAIATKMAELLALEKESS